MAQARPFEESARARLFVRAPGRKGNDQACGSLVEFADKPLGKADTEGANKSKNDTHERVVFDLTDLL